MDNLCTTMHRYDFQGNLLVNKILECLTEDSVSVLSSFDLVSREKNEADAELLSCSENLSTSTRLSTQDSN